MSSLRTDDLGLRQFCPHTPTPTQQAFLDLECPEALFGGSAGGGKSDALLMAALKHVHVPGYSALILRRDFPRLSKAGAIMDRAKEWLFRWRPQVEWSEKDKRFTFPSGAKLEFGYLDAPDDRWQYQSAEYQFVGWDELTEFRLDAGEANPYLFLWNRLRRSKQIAVPPRMRAASNPGNIGHAFVKERFLTEQSLAALAAGELGVFYADEDGERAFVPSRLGDNPHVVHDEYVRGLMHLPPVARARLLGGDWSVIENALIQAEYLRYYTMRGDIYVPRDANNEPIRAWVVDRRLCARFLTVDTAGTEKQKREELKKGKRSWSVGQVWDYWPAMKVLFLVHVWRAQVEWNGLKSGVLEVATQFRPRHVLIENAHHGPPLAAELRSQAEARAALRGMNVSLVNPVTDEMRGQSGVPGKVERATSLLSMLAEGKVFLPVGALWLPGLETEWLSWTGDELQTTDQIDAASYAAHRVRRGFGSGKIPLAVGLSGRGR